MHWDRAASVGGGAVELDARLRVAAGVRIGNFVQLEGRSGQTFDVDCVS